MASNFEIAQRVTKLSGELARAATQQAQGVEMIAKAIAQIREVTQRNAASGSDAQCGISVKVSLAATLPNCMGKLRA